MVPYPKIVPGPIRSYTVKKNHIDSSAVTKRLQDVWIFVNNFSMGNFIVFDLLVH